MDIRKQRTRQTIHQCFLALLKEKPVTAITVTELCALAGINRGTFYKHYLDIPDLQQQLEQQVLDSLAQYLQDFALHDQADYRATLVSVLHHARSSGEPYYLLCSANAQSDLPGRTLALLNRMVIPFLQQKQPGMDPAQAAILYRYVTQGSAGVMAQWVSGQLEISAEEVAQILMRLNMAAASQLIPGEEVGR